MKKSTKRLFALLMATVMLLALTACGGKKEEPAPEKEEPKTEQPAPEKDQAPAHSDSPLEYDIFPHGKISSTTLLHHS